MMSRNVVVFVIGVVVGVFVVSGIFLIINQSHSVLAQAKPENRVEAHGDGDIMIVSGGINPNIFDMCWIVKKEKGNIEVRDPDNPKKTKKEDIDMIKLACYKWDQGGFIRLLGVRNITFELKNPTEIQNGNMQQIKVENMFKEWRESLGKEKNAK